MAPAVRRRFLRNVGYAMLTSEVEARIDPRPGDPWPRHEQFSGASLAVTARAYHEVGGLPPLPSSEDVALGAALRRADIEIRHSLAVRVCTSGRLDGRAPSGLAALLAGWAGLTSDEAFQRVPSAANVVDRVTCRRALRDLWERARERREVSASEVARLSAFAGVSEPWLRCALVSAERFGVLLDAVEARSAWYRDPDLVDVRVALADLRAWLAHDRQHAIRVMPKPTLAALEQVEAVGPLPEPTQVA
jgi:hypothetical protein